MRHHKAKALALASSLLLLLAAAAPGGARGETIELSCAPQSSSAEKGSARIRPYTDPSQLAVPWPRISHRKQPWRGYAETMPGRHFLDGLGVHWGEDPTAASDTMAPALATAGIRRVRLEIPWRELEWSEERFHPRFTTRITAILRSLREHGLKPLILLNAHHGAPGPFRVVPLRIPKGAAEGARAIEVDGDLDGVEPFRAYLADFSASKRPAPLVTKIAGRRLELSRPLPRAVASGETLQLARLKYSPLHRVGTREFRHSLSGWLRYVTAVTALVSREYGRDDYEVEVWNELTFGSAFLDVGYYGDPARPTPGAPDLLRRGGAAWELAAATVTLLADIHPRVRPIWGFSSTTFFRTPIAELPPGFVGQSYHPYGTARRCYEASVDANQAHSIDGFSPAYCSAMPEGWAHTFLKTQSLMRLLNPEERRTKRPAGTQTFAHYVTEHGIHPPTVGAEEEAAAWRAKTKFLLRAPLFWLHRGIDAFYAFQAYDPVPTGMGVLQSPTNPGAPLTALARLVAAFGPSRSVDEPRTLDLGVAALGESPTIFTSPNGSASLTHEDVVTLLPFQTSASRFVVGAYVMTRDFPHDLAAEPFEIAIAPLRGSEVRVRLHDPLNDTASAEKSCPAPRGRVAVRVSLTDSPRLLVIEDGEATR